jgi:hypothetical protein
MRHTEFWTRMEHVLGPAYARVWSSQQVLSPLGGRTVDQALADGEAPKAVWRVVADTLSVPEAQR